MEPARDVSQTTSSNGTPSADVREQRRIWDRIQQERADYQLALSISRSGVQSPPSNPRSGTAPMSNTQPSGVRRGRGGPPLFRAVQRGRRPSNSTRNNNNNNNTPRRQSGGSQNAGGPIRRGSAVRQTRGTGVAQNGRRRTTQRNPNAPVMRFQGDRLVMEVGNNTVDITSDTYFPDDADDRDYDRDSSDDDETGSESSDSSDSSGSDSDEEEEAVAPAPSSSSARRESGRARGSTRGTTRGRAQRGGHGGTRPAVSENYIQLLLTDALRVDRSRDYVPVDNAEDDDDEDSSDDGMDDTNDGGHDSDGTIEIGDSGDSDSDDDLAPIRPDRNHIQQPIFDEDRQMYDRELDLYLNDNEYVVPPAKEQKHKGKPLEPDSTWGDCTMCSNPPVKPQGCTKCLQILGCTDCVNRWHVTRSGSLEGPSCPLCRAVWGLRPSVMLMKSIEKRREKENNKAASSSGPSTSSSST